MKNAVCLFILLVHFLKGFAQGLVADFAMISTACRNQSIEIANNSTNASSFEWDVCHGDLSLNPTAAVVSNLSGNVTVGIDVVFDGANWFAFVTNQNADAILRLDFGTDLTNTPAITNLGNVGGLTNRPADIRVIKENGNWYGFVYGLSAPMVSRINFGTSLTNTTSSSTPITSSVVFAGAGATNGGLDMLESAQGWHMVLTRNSAVDIVRFPDITAMPVPQDVLSTSIPGATLGDIVLREVGNNFFAYVVSFGTRALYQMNFGATIFSTPVVENLSFPALSNFSPYGLDLGFDAGVYFLFISTLEGALLRVDLGATLPATVANGESLGNLGILENTLKMKLIKSKSRWISFSVSWSSTNLYRVDFPQPACEYPQPIQIEDPILTFLNSGNQFVSLRAFSANGDFDETTHNVTISSNVAPDVAFSVTGVCVTGMVNFDAVSTSNGQFLWSFGDSEVSIEEDPVHQFQTVGAYQVRLEMVADNGCVNFVKKVWNIFPPPVPSFDSPTGLVCTNNEFAFANNTQDIYQGFLTYNWSVDGNSVSTERDLKYSFSTSGNHDIKLSVSIPGCTNELIQTLNGVQVGPTVGFDTIGKCQDELISFVNKSDGSIASYTWDFGNGEQSSERDHEVVYGETGTFEVSLNTLGTNGCNSEVTKTLVIYSRVNPAFSTDLPPFSCSGSPSQFYDLTPTPNDSNIESWAWTFESNATSNLRNPQHIFATSGDYNVTLKVTTDRGCNATTTKLVRISESPIPDFSFDATCINSVAHFFDKSPSGSVKYWQWKIDNSNYSVADPTHIFLTSGNRSVTLKLTGTNDCIASVTKTVYVPPVPLLDFEMTNPCVGQESVFESKIVSPDDAPNLITWQFENASPLTGTTTRFAFDTPGAHPVGMTVQNQSGCQYQLVKNITTYAAPIVSFGTSVDTGPAPLEVNFTNTTTGAVSYQWLTNGSESATTTNFKTTFSTVGDYVIDLVAMSDRGCMSSITKDIKVIVPRTELALSQFNLFEDPISGALRNQLMVTNASNYPIRSFDVILDLGNGSSVRETITQEIKVGETSTFLLSNSLVMVSSGYVCAEIVLPGDEKTDNNKLCTPLTDKSVLFTPSPNPATDVVNVEVIAPAGGTSMARIVNSMGQLTFTCQLELQKGLNRFELDIRSLQPGIYFLTFETGSERQIHRLVIN